MKEINDLAAWASGVVGKYDTGLNEGFDASNPLPKRIPRAELERLVPRNKTNPPKKTGGPSPEIREKLAQLRAEFAAKAGIAEGDQPPVGSTYSPLSSVTRDRPAPDPLAVTKRKREIKALRKFMGYDD
jgi:hypothetical protein